MLVYIYVCRIHTPVRLRGKTVLAKPSEKSRKIWGLKIVDLRLLWSLPIRDSVFSYFAAYFDMFAEESVVEEEDVRIMHSNANKGGDKERAGIQDFLAELSSKKTSAMPRGVLTQIKSSKVMGPDVRARSTGRGVSRNLYRVVQDVSMQKHFLSLGPEDKADKVMAKTHTAVDISKMKSCRDLGPRALSTIRSPRGSGAFATRKVEEPRSRSPYVSSPMDSSASKPPPDFDSVPYFRIYLVDPQINFLDDKSEGSVVCCTGVSSLEGRHSLVATAFTGDGKGGDPKRKNDIRLRCACACLFVVCICVLFLNIVCNVICVCMYIMCMYVCNMCIYICNTCVYMYVIHVCVKDGQCECLHCEH